MKVFQASGDQVEILGNAIIPVIKGISLEKVSNVYLAKHHLDNVIEGQFYKQQKYLDLLKDVHETMDLVLFRIGENIFTNAKFPPALDTFEKAIFSIDQAYHMNHRGGEIGHYRASKINDYLFHLECDNPYPCNFDMGIIQGIGKNFGVKISIDHKDQHCRMKGDDGCIYSINVK